jgi:DinB superfamily
MRTVESDLRGVVEAAARRLRALSEADSAKAPAPGKWSPRQVIGHLVDSASNNHQRFVRAQFTEDLVFPGYAQEEWVAAQDYQSVPWTELVELWRLYNLHVARVIEAAPAAARERPRARHNLDEIAWQTVPRDQPVTLEFFMRDYLAHLEHHLRQIPGATER